MRPDSRPLAALVVLALAAALPAATAAADPLPRPPLVATSGAARLLLASGAAVALPPLPAGARLESTAALAHGWVAAGSAPAAPAKRAQAVASELLVLLSDGGPVSLLPPPARSAALLREPLPLVDEGRLAGLAWLEGDTRRTLAVRFAAWNGAGWDDPQTVSAPGPGSQLALTAARLGDGSFLLAWSAFDGHDDEIVWSRRSAGGTWSKPTRAAADNDVPDVTPALVATNGGALLAWSRYDAESGEYAVVVARFRNGRFDAPHAVGAPGTGAPGFEPVAPGGNSAARLLVRTAAPAGWQVLDLGADGRPVRAAAVRMAAPAAKSVAPAPLPGERPLVAATDADGVTLRFPESALERTAAWQRGESGPAPALQKERP